MPVDDQLRARFVTEYRAWKEGKETLSGTPVADWKSITARQAIFLEANNIFTVEALAAVSDGNIHNVTDGRELRDKAVRWLKKKDTTDLAAENASLKARLDALEKAAAKKRAPMSQAQRDAIAATAKERWAEKERLKLRVAELEKGLPSADAASVTDMSETPGVSPEVLPAV